MGRISPPPKDLNSFLGRKWLESLARESIATAFSVDNSDGSLIISPTTGAVFASINLNHANIWLADQSVPDEAYGAGWNGSVEVPTKNALYDKIELVVAAIPSAYTNEQAQDAIGAMIDATLVYVDLTPSLGLNLNNANIWTADQSVPDEAYGAGWNGSVEVPTKNAVYDKIESLPVLASGTYTPTRSAEANLDANVTMTEAQYMRVGGTVTVSGRFTADPTLTATPTSFEISLPVVSNLGAVEDLAGTAFCGAIVGQGAEINGVVANDTAKIQWISSDITSQSWSYSFTYQVI